MDIRANDAEILCKELEKSALALMTLFHFHVTDAVGVAEAGMISFSIRETCFALLLFSIPRPIKLWSNIANAISGPIPDCLSYV